MKFAYLFITASIVTGCVTREDLIYSASQQCQRWGYTPGTGAYNQCVDLRVEQREREISEAFKSVRPVNPYDNTPSSGYKMDFCTVDLSCAPFEKCIDNHCH